MVVMVIVIVIVVMVAVVGFGVVRRVCYEYRGSCGRCVGR